MLWFIKSILVNEFLPPKYKDLLGPIPSSTSIPVEKSTQYPAHAMQINVSSTDGNVEIVENLERQLGTKKEWYNSYIHLCHGDLGTQEHHDTTRFFHAIESSSKHRLQWLVTVPGVFHIQMAAVDAIWRTHIRGEALCSNEGGTYKLFEILHPTDSARLNSNPSYCMLNDGIQHLIRAHLRVCWEEVTGLDDLCAFASLDPSWDVIEELALKIFKDYIAKEEIENL